VCLWLYGAVAFVMFIFPSYYNEYFYQQSAKTLTKNAETL